MRIIVDDAVFRGDRGLEHHADLLALFRLGLARHNTIEVDPARSDLFSQWVAREGEQTQRLCRQVVEQGVKRRARQRRIRTVRVADTETAAWGGVEPRLPPPQAVRFLQRPLALLLENSRNDRNFLMTITRLASNFDLRKLIADRVIEIRSNGGVDENRMCLEGIEREESYRLWVMCDSDALCGWSWPKDGSAPGELGSTARELRDACTGGRVPIHVLQRRSIDNYVPLPLFEHWSFQDQQKRERIYQALASLVEDQRYHYNMKDGFSKKRDRNYASSPNSIYEGLDPGVREALERGLNTRDFSVTMLFDEDERRAKGLPLPERWLLQDKQHEEAQRIVQSILELL